MNALVTKIRAWFVPDPPREDKLITLMTEMVQSQRAQTEVFSKLVGAWTQPVEVGPVPRTQSEQDALDALEEAADMGDPDAQAILASDEAQKSYFTQFRQFR